MSGQIVHFEIPADDTAKGREFWGGLFGWQFQARGGLPVERESRQEVTAMARVLTQKDSSRWMTQGGWQSDRDPPLGEKHDDAHPTLALLLPFACYVIACAAIVVFIAVKAASVPLW